jgi:hypothetical protein
VRAELRADGEYLGTIDLYEKDPESKTPGAAEVVWTHEFATPKQRILEIKLVHVSPNPDAKLMVEVLVDVTRK